MAEETTQAPQDSVSTTNVPEGAAAPVVAPTQASEAPDETGDGQDTATLNTAVTQAETTGAPSAETPQAPDAIQPFIDKACQTIQHEVDDNDLGKFLRAHIKTFHEEWDAWSDSAKDAYIHMMTAQFVQRKAATTQIMMGQAFKLPEPSAQATLFESLKQSQIKPQKCVPVLLMPPNLRPTYSLKT
jgi:hypothetical protein